MEHLEIIHAYQKLKRETAPRLLREFRGQLSYQKCAELLGVHRTFLWKIEHAQELISDELLERILQWKS